MPNWCEGVITDRKVWTDGLFTIKVRVPGIDPFLPGQFLQLGVRGESVGGSEGKISNRPYSVASPHGEELEFFIVLVEEGELTPKLWALEIGSPVIVSQRAAGSFTLQKAPTFENLWLFATGTGLAPYVAMARDSYLWDTFQRVFVVHGVRVKEDLAYTEELREFEAQFPGRFKLIQALSRDQADGCFRGRITDVLESGMLEESAGAAIGPDNSTVMLCGNPAMLDTMEEMLKGRGLTLHRSKSPGNIILERYW